MLNTMIEYLYRDADNYKTYNMAVVSGEYTEGMIGRIISSLHDRHDFLPTRVGLPERRFDAWDDQSDGPWFELYAEGFRLTGQKPTCDMTIEELADRFSRMSGRWLQALDTDGREVGHSILEDGMPDTGRSVLEGRKPTDRKLSALLTSGRIDAATVVAAAWDGCGGHGETAVAASGSGSVLVAVTDATKEIIAAEDRGADEIDVDVYDIGQLPRLDLNVLVGNLLVRMRRVDMVSANPADPSVGRLARARRAIDAIRPGTADVSQ